MKRSIENRATNFIMCDLVTDNSSKATNIPQHVIFIRGVDHAHNVTES